MTDMEYRDERLDHEAWLEERASMLQEWERGGKVGPEPEWPAPAWVGHTHTHDHGICVHPWLVDHATDELSIETVLKHELAHAIAGTFGHECDWHGMCDIIGYGLTATEKEAYGWQPGAEVGVYG